MIGKVIWVSGGEPMEAVLNSNGYWTCSDPVIEGDLNTDLNCDDYSPADGPRGYKQLLAAAKRYSGRVEAPEPPPTIPGLLY